MSISRSLRVRTQDPSSPRKRILRRLAIAGCIPCLMAATTLPLWLPPDLSLVSRLHEGTAEHLDQADLVALLRQGRSADAFALAFEHGDELFETAFNVLDGVGARVGDGQRFTRLPRADLSGAGEWSRHVPARSTGPNASACNACHRQPTDDGAGAADSNAIRDPLHTGSVARMIQRNTPHLLGAGAVQVLAEEMTAELQSIASNLEAQVRQTGRPATAPLQAKGVDFGTLRAHRTFFGRVVLDLSRVEGIGEDLVVRPFQWKGSVAHLRDFNRDAAHNELGMQATELTGHGVDGDGDTIVDELTVGDMTAMAIYVAAQPRPTTKLELSRYGEIPPLDPAEVASIQRGEATFASIGCADCHVPRLLIADPVFREPSRLASHRDERFPTGQSAGASGVLPDLPVSFDLTQDQPDNVLQVNGQTVRMGSFERQGPGGPAVVELYGDLKWHRMGRELAEPIDEQGTGSSTYLTENLWGVGSTAPYLHDGRATTLTEAILAHGGEADASRRAFVALPLADQQDVIAFLDNLVLYKIE